MKKILFTGTHGTGKSTAALNKAAEIKTNNRALSVKIIEENVRELIGKLSIEMNTPSFQKICFTDHLLQEYIAETKYDVIVCDRTCFDTLVYGLAYGVSIPPELFSFALSHLNTFDEVYFYRPKHAGYDIISDGFRDVNRDNQLKVDKEFESLLKLWGGKYTEVFV